MSDKTNPGELKALRRIARKARGTVSVPKHNGYVGTPFLSDYWQAGCSCNWEGPLQPTQTDAAADLCQHYAEVQS